METACDCFSIGKQCYTIHSSGPSCLRSLTGGARRVKKLEVPLVEGIPNFNLSSKLLVAKKLLLPAHSSEIQSKKMETMEIWHFAPRHPLILLTNITGPQPVQAKDGKNDQKVKCNSCNSLVEGAAYKCRDCEFFLHKSCSELPRELKHPHCTLILDFVWRKSSFVS